MNDAKLYWNTLYGENNYTSQCYIIIQTSDNKIGHEHQYVLFYFIYFLLFTLQSKHHCLLK